MLHCFASCFLRVAGSSENGAGISFGLLGNTTGKESTIDREHVPGDETGCI